MSAATVARNYSFTVRLSPEEKAALEALAKRFDLDKSATVREALQLAFTSNNTSLTQRGLFVPLHAKDLVFPVRLSGETADDR